MTIHEAHHGLGIVASGVAIHDRITGSDFGFHDTCWDEWDANTDPRFVPMGPLASTGAQCILCHETI